MKRKYILSTIVGFSLGIATCGVMGFTQGGVSNGSNDILITDSRGGAYLYKQNKIYYINGQNVNQCKIHKLNDAHARKNFYETQL